MNTKGTLTGWFPFTIQPEVIIGNAKYTRDCYNMIMDQLKSIKIYDGIGVSAIYVGDTTKISGNDVNIRIHDLDFIKFIIKLNWELCVLTLLDVDAEPDANNVMIAKTAMVDKVALVPRVSALDIDEFRKSLNFRNMAILKEKTFDLR
jgi:hypothetical protein